MSIILPKFIETLLLRISIIWQEKSQSSKKFVDEDVPITMEETLDGIEGHAQNMGEVGRIGQYITRE